MKTLGILALASLLSVMAASAGVCGEIVSTVSDRLGLRVTVYGNNLASISEKRSVRIGKGENRIVFEGVSSQIKPETAFLRGDGLSVLEQNFEYDLISPQSLLQKYVGREVIFVTINPITGEERREKATVLGAGSGIVLKTANHIITDIKGQLRFPDLPDNLRERPTLTMLVKAEEAGQQELGLTYLSAGLSWKADYIAELNEYEDSLGLKGWVTLSNTSGVTYRDAELKVIGGNVNNFQPHLRSSNSLKMSAMAEPVSDEEGMNPENLFDYHLYTVDRKTTIAENQQKQVKLMSSSKVKCTKRYSLRGAPYYYRSRYKDIEPRQKVEVFVDFVNESKTGLGEPLPAGIVRVYRKDSMGFLQFIGEDRMSHVPVGEVIELRLGEAFDIAADRRQVSFRKISGERGNEVVESGYEITLRNSKKVPVTVLIEEPVQGDWEILSESLPHRRKDASVITWEVEVAAGGEQTLDYRVRIRW